MTTPVVEEGSATVEPARCTVCGHETSRHDAVSERFCQATQAKALSRPCICR